MVLSNVEIIAEIQAGRLVFNPPIPTGNAENRIDTSSVDMLLHEELIVLPESNEVAGVTVDPSAKGINVMSILETYGEIITMTDNQPYHMPRNRLVIGKTLEYVKLPPHIAARIEGKSSLARLGLSVHVTAPTVLAGFEGRLYLEMSNIGPFSLALRKEMRIAQLIFEHTGLPPLDKYAGQYHRQT